VSLKHSELHLSRVDTAGGMIVTYSDDAGRIRAISGWSGAAGAHVGGALGLIPPAMTSEMVAQRYLDDNVIENLTEVCNVLAATFGLAGGQHVRLQKAYYPSNAAPPDVAIYLYQHTARHDFILDVAGYGAGPMSTVIID